MSSKPTILLCTGAFHTPSHYAPLSQTLQSSNFEVLIPPLPTMSVSDASPHDTSRINPVPPPGGWPTGSTDAEHIKEQIRTLVDAGKRVLLVGHSYGGWVMTESAVPELRESVRRAEGLEGGIVGLVHLSGYILPAGQSVDSFFTALAGAPPAFVRLHGEGKTGLVVPFDAEQYFFGDLPESEARHWASELRPQPVIFSPLSQASYVDLPTAYLLCSQDKVFPLVVQEMMVKLALDQGANVRRLSCDAGHSPFLSWTEGTAGVIGEFAEGL